MNSGSSNLDALLLKYTNKKEREILEAYAGTPGGSRARRAGGSNLALRTVGLDRLTYPPTHCCSPALTPDLYALLKTTEKLERAYVRDAIPAKEYEPACERLIGQYRTLWEAVRSEKTVGPCVGLGAG